MTLVKLFRVTKENNMDSSRNIEIDAPRRVQDGSIGSDLNNDNGSRSGQFLNENEGGGGDAGTASATIVLTRQQHSESSVNLQEPVLRLQLRPRSNVTWDQSVVDNEGMGRKSSKRCCIFHKVREFGESSTESSEDDDDHSTSSSSSGGAGDGRAQRPIAKKKNKKGK